MTLQEMYDMNVNVLVRWINHDMVRTKRNPYRWCYDICSLRDCAKKLRNAFLYGENNNTHYEIYDIVNPRLKRIKFEFTSEGKLIFWRTDETEIVTAK